MKLSIAKQAGLVAFLMLFLPSIGSAQSPDGNIVSVASTDDLSAKGGYRYRAVYTSDVKNDRGGAMFIEKLKFPAATGSPFRPEWKNAVHFRKAKGVKSHIDALPWESRVNCCVYSKLQWDSFRLSFEVQVGTRRFKCKSTDVRKGKPDILCQK